MARPKLSDPGGEVSNAPVGSEEWAKRWRLEIQHIRHNIPREPERFVRFYDLGNEHRVWTLLNKPDGSTFKSFDEFCLTKEPWGLSASPDEVRQWLALVKGQKAVKLETVPEPKPGPGRGKVLESVVKENNGHRGHCFPVRTSTRLRAINRAPEPIRKLYEQDGLSQVWAARLGPLSPSPAEAERIAAIVLALKGTTTRRAADDLVRTMLGARMPSKVDRAVALAKTMTPAERKTLVLRVRKLDQPVLKS